MKYVSMGLHNLLILKRNSLLYVKVFLTMLFVHAERQEDKGALHLPVHGQNDRRSKGRVHGYIRRSAIC